MTRTSTARVAGGPSAGRGPASLFSTDGAPGLKAVLDGGVDEAGLGPLLGPLCVGFAAFERPQGASELWKALASAVAPRPSGAGARLVVADSKLVYDGEGGFERLERTALAFLAAGLGLRPETVASLLEILDPGSADRLRAIPWYQSLDAPLPRRSEGGRLDEAADRLRAALDRAGVRLRDLGVRVVAEDAFNRGVERCGNKAEFLLEEVAEVVRRLASIPRRGAARLVVDRLGGRRFYGERLARHLPEFLPSPLRERRARSDYLLASATGPAELLFAVGGERLSLPCALASMLAKYARELLMEALNDHFARRVPGFRSTAGYVEDGRRFVAELRSRLPDGDAIVRSLVRRR